MKKIALILTGFIRDYKNLEDKLEFIRNNQDFEIDVFIGTYDIVGLPCKEPTDSKAYIENSEYLDYEKIDSLLSPEGVFTLKYLKSKKRVKDFYDSNKWDIVASKGSMLATQSKRNGEEITDEFVLRRSLSQWNLVKWAHNNFRQHCEKKNKKYDCVIRARFDVNLHSLNLKEVSENFSADTIYTENKVEPRGIITQGNSVISDWFALGDQKSMEIYCNLGKLSNYNFIFNNKDFIKHNDVFYDEVGKSIQLSSERTLTYWLFEVNKLNFSHIKPIGLGVKRAAKYFSKYKQKVLEDKR